MTSFMTFTKMTDRSVDASCLLGSVSLLGTGLSAISADRPALLATLAVSERNERPTQHRWQYWKPRRMAPMASRPQPVPDPRRRRRSSSTT